jgi:hypothetical protein
MIHQTGGECKFFVAAGPLFRQNFFPEGSIKKARGEIFPSAHRIGASAAAAVVAAAVVIAAAVIAAPAAAAEQDDDKDDDPQAAVAAPAVVIAAPHDEYLLNYESIKRAVCRSRYHHMAREENGCMGKSAPL